MAPLRNEDYSSASLGYISKFRRQTLEARATGPCDRERPPKKLDIPAPPILSPLGESRLRMGVCNDGGVLFGQFG